MKIAVSTDDGYVSAHFGRCASYTIFDVQDRTILNKEEIPNPGHQPGFLPQFLSEKGVRCIIAGGMGPRAQALFTQKNIETLIGVQGAVDEVIQKFINRELEAGEDLCDHGQEGAGHGVHEPRRETPAQPAQTVSQTPGRKICVTSLGPDLDSDVDPKFGRAHYFLIFDPQTGTFESVKNSNRELAHGAGIQTAQFIANQDVGVILTGDCGPKAARVLETAGIRIKTGVSGTAKEALAAFKTEG
ncbi:MAG: NifB/NifX family molybdenum-iron cluster-binding protein [Candidatus Aminicenantes bacterium]|jgi:predicted Fe-Mo cluster-binding NifX family protein